MERFQASSCLIAKYRGAVLGTIEIGQTTLVVRAVVPIKLGPGSRPRRIEMEGFGRRAKWQVEGPCGSEGYSGGASLSEFAGALFRGHRIQCRPSLQEAVCWESGQEPAGPGVELILKTDGAYRVIRASPRQTRGGARWRVAWLAGGVDGSWIGHSGAFSYIDATLIIPPVSPPFLRRVP